MGLGRNRHYVSEHEEKQLLRSKKEGTVPASASVPRALRAGSDSLEVTQSHGKLGG